MRGRFAGERNPAKKPGVGKKISLAKKGKYRNRIKVKCENCGKEFLRMRSRIHTRIFCSKKCSNKKLRRKEHSCWKGGISRNAHSLTNPQYKKWRAQVFQRDNWICQTCRAKSSEGNPVYLEAHHIKSWAKYFNLRFKIDNGITLCYNCHKLATNYTKKNV